MDIRVWLLFSLLGGVSAGPPTMYGEITSPNYPQGYPSNTQETWEISVPEGYGIRLYFTHLDIEPSENCEYDSLQVIVGDVNEQKICGRKFVGSRGAPLEENYYPSSSLSIVFQSDFSNQERYTGFSAYYIAVDLDECEETDGLCSHFCNNYIGGYFCSCPPEYYLNNDNHTCAGNCSGGLYTEMRGQISSPRYPSPYLENARCVYTVHLDLGFEVILNFQAEDFDIEAAEDGSCSYDSLTIKAGGQTFGPYCGSSPPSPPQIRTGSNKVDIIFQTDSGGNNRGWKIRYVEDAIPCPNQVTDHSVLEPRQDKYVFRDWVTVTCEKGYETLQNEVQILTFRATCQGDGTWTNRDRKCQLVDCGDPWEIEMGSVTSSLTTYGSEIRYRCDSQYYKLIGDDTFRCTSEGLWVSKDGSKDPPKCIAVCGIPSNPIESRPRIFGGIRAKLGDFPWQIAFTTPKLGSGALISDRWVLTAAHIMQDNDNPDMLGGVVNIKTEGQKHILSAKKVIIHPKWLKDAEEKKNFDNDIALVQLTRKVIMGPCISPICLPRKGAEAILFEDKLGQVAGWGKNEKNRTTRILFFTSVPLLSLDKCNLVEGAVLTGNMLCAGIKGKDACQGDSGAPLVFNDPQIPETQFVGGIVSWGPPECGNAGLYTKVENYLDWIKDTIQKEEKDMEPEQDEGQTLCG
ncbi:complement C1s subcomponent isoform 1-T2 [Discoglossus pictus]